MTKYNEFAFLWDNLEEEDRDFTFIVAQNSSLTVFGLGNTMNEAIMDAATWSAVDQNHPDLREILQLLERDEFSIYHKPEGLMRCPNLPTLEALEELLS